METYRRHSVLPATDVEQALLVMLRFRWAVHADYFARRIADRDLTGIGGSADNEKGLEDARRWLSHLENIG